MLAEYHTREMETISERGLENALKFGRSREIDTKEGEAHAEGLELVPPNSSEVLESQVELDGAVGEALIG